MGMFLVSVKCNYILGLLLQQEEQNASSSANYDVELLHSRQAHQEVSRTGTVDDTSGGV